MQYVLTADSNIHHTLFHIARWVQRCVQDFGDANGVKLSLVTAIEGHNARVIRGLWSGEAANAVSLVVLGRQVVLGRAKCHNWQLVVCIRREGTIQ